MKRAKKLMLLISLVMLTIFIDGCGMMNKDDNKETNKTLNKEEQIKQKFSQTLDMYPIKNLEDLYDKEGFRDEEFDKDDKGMWVLRSELATKKIGQNLRSEGMTIYLDRNKKQATGYYFINEYKEDSKGMKNQKEKIPVEIKNNQILIKSPVNDKKLKKKIEDFKFFSQYASFKDLNRYKNSDISYNPNEPSYDIQYNLDGNDENVKKLHKIYGIPVKYSPTLNMKIVGDLNKSSVGYKKLEYVFIRNQDKEIVFDDYLDYQPSMEG